MRHLPDMSKSLQQLTHEQELAIDARQAPRTPAQPWALFRVHLATGTRVRLPSRAWSPVTESMAREMAAADNKVSALAGPPDGWETQAHPDQDEQQNQK
jgi:hypothetical protein